MNGTHTISQANQEGGSLQEDSRGLYQNELGQLRAAKPVTDHSDDPRGQGSKPGSRTLHELEGSMGAGSDQRVAKFREEQHQHAQRQRVNLLARQEYQMDAAVGRGDHAKSKQRSTGRKGSADPPAFGASPGLEEAGATDQDKTELMKQFGREKGQEYYGAIKELEEFLDPKVLGDQEL